MVRYKGKKKDIKPEVFHNESDMDYLDDSPDHVTTDKWRNKWDSDGEFSDMDFRLVDDD